MENLNTVNDVQQTVVESAADGQMDVNTSGAETGTLDNGANVGAATHNGQSKDDNRAFAQMRRNMEAAETEKAELGKILSEMGYSGNSAEIREQLEAKRENITVEALRQRKKDAENAVKNHPAYLEMQKEMISRGKADDLRAIQGIDPTVQSVDELGEEYLTLRAAGVSAAVAFRALRGADSVKESKPESIGAVGNSKGLESEFFTSEQLDKLTEKDLDNEEIFIKAMRSTLRL